MDQTVWLNALPDQMTNLILSRLADRRPKLRFRALDLTRWLVAKGLWTRNRKGFNFVRGSHKNREEGLKQDAFLQSLGFTSDKLRGAFEALIDGMVIERLPGQVYEKYINRFGFSRYKPVLYRFTAEFYAILFEAKPAPKKELSSPIENPSSLSLTPLQETKVSQDIGVIRGGNPRISTPAAPSKPATPSGPLTGSLAASLANLKGLVFGTPKAAPAAPETIIPRISPEVQGDLDFTEQFPFQHKLTPSAWPRVFDDHKGGGIKQEVAQWLINCIGDPVRSHGVRWFQQPDVPLAVRRTGMSPLELWRSFKVIRDMRVGFTNEDDLFAFHMAWSGKAKPGES